MIENTTFLNLTRANATLFNASQSAYSSDSSDSSLTFSLSTSSSSSSSFGGVVRAVRRAWRRTISASLTLETDADAETCEGRLWKHCKHKNNPNNPNESAGSAWRGMFDQKAGLPEWIPFVTWFTALLVVSLLTAALVYRFLRKRGARGEYEELQETNAAPMDGGNARGEGNSSRQRFLESRRAAAQRSYGTDGATNAEDE